MDRRGGERMVKNSTEERQIDGETTREREVTLGKLPFHRRVVVRVVKPCHWVSP